MGSGAGTTDSGGGATRGFGASLRTVFTNPALRRLQVALAGSAIGDWAYMTAVVVWAYQEGGPGVVGVWVAVRYLLMAVAGPSLGALSDRYPRKHVMIGADLVRAVLVAAAAGCVMADAPGLTVFTLAIAASVAGTAFRPAQLAWTPDLVERPEELTAANSVASTFDSLAFFVGPAIAALLLGFADVSSVFWVNVATFLWSAALVWAIRPGRDRAGVAGDEVASGSPASSPWEGFRVIAADRDQRMVVALLCTQTLVAGAEYVFAVTIAVEVLGGGPEALGYLEAVLGVGALVGGVFVIARALRARLARGLALGVVLWSAPVAAVGFLPLPVVAFLAMAVIGFANPLVDVNYATLLQRVAPAGVLGRVFGVAESASVLAMAAGALLMPLLLDQLGLRGALIVVGLVPTVLVIPWARRIRRLDDTLRAPRGLALLTGASIFRPLAPPTLEALARRLDPVTAPAGTVVVAEGEAADRFFLVEQGRVEVTQGGRLLRHQGPGEFFGEIGLLRDVPRTATVTAAEDTVLLVLGRSDFLRAVTSDVAANREADQVVNRRLAA